MSLTVHVVVAADPVTSWVRWTDFGTWGEWNPACVSAEIDGLLQPGTRLRLQLRHPHGRVFWTAPRVTRAEPGEEIAWETRAFGFRAPTAVTFAEHDGGTLVTLTSEVRGVLAFTYRMTFPEKAQGLLWSGALTGFATHVRDVPSARADGPLGQDRCRR